MEMSRMCVGCLFCSRCPADPASPVAGVTGIVMRQVYTGPNPNEFGPRGAVRPSTPVRAYAGEVLKFSAVLETSPCSGTIGLPSVIRWLKPRSVVLRIGKRFRCGCLVWG